MISGVSSTNSLSYWLQQMQQAGSSQSASSSDDIFSQLDTNGDGVLSSEEFAVGKPDRQKDFANQVLGSQTDSASLINLLQSLDQVLSALSGSGASDNTVSQPGEPMSQDDLLAKLDTDGDGSLSQSEFVGGRPQDMSETQANELYSKLDTNGDGVISSAEFAKTGPQGAESQGAESQNGSAGIASLLFQMVSKYAQFAQGSQGMSGIASLAAMA